MREPPSQKPLSVDRAITTAKMRVTVLPRTIATRQRMKTAARAMRPVDNFLPGVSSGVAFLPAADEAAGFLGIFEMNNLGTADRLLRAARSRLGEVAETTVCGYTVYTVEGGAPLRLSCKAILALRSASAESRAL